MEDQEILKACRKKEQAVYKKNKEELHFFRQQHWVQDNYGITFSPKVDGKELKT